MALSVSKHVYIAPNPKTKPASTRPLYFIQTNICAALELYPVCIVKNESVSKALLSEEIFKDDDSPNYQK